METATTPAILQDPNSHVREIASSGSPSSIAEAAGWLFGMSAHSGETSREYALALAGISFLGAAGLSALAKHQSSSDPEDANE